MNSLSCHSGIRSDGRADRAAAQEEGRRHDVELEALLAQQARGRAGCSASPCSRSVIRDPPEVAAGRLDADPVRRADARRVRGPDRQDDVLLVQDLVVLEVVQERRRARGRARWSGTPRCPSPGAAALLQHADELGERHVVLRVFSIRMRVPRRQVNITIISARRRRAASSRPAGSSARWRPGRQVDDEERRDHGDRGPSGQCQHLQTTKKAITAVTTIVPVTAMP